jgi:hypothetical protein
MLCIQYWYNLLTSWPWYGWCPPAPIITPSSTQWCRRTQKNNEEGEAAETGGEERFWSEGEPKQNEQLQSNVTGPGEPTTKIGVPSEELEYRCVASSEWQIALWRKDCRGEREEECRNATTITKNGNKQQQGEEAISLTKTKRGAERERSYKPQKLQDFLMVCFNVRGLNSEMI